GDTGQVRDEDPRSASRHGPRHLLLGAGMSRSAAGTGDDRAKHADEMVRSEEQLRVGTEEQEVGRARLRKVVVTEDVSTTVPVSHEEVHLVREPIGEGDRMRGTEIGEAEAEVTLHAERPVVRKEAVAVERVRLETEKVTEQREVSDTVRKEEIQYDDGTGSASGEEDDWKGGRSGPTR
ncbi:YsnF/AvaK domain-containing protein, partial [Streptomyces sp. EL9]|uniref:YsnF/AvaK domain-containing protein n=1 Tax=Streptomyces sp. EL9 TaxID=2841666 RepID=UPI002094E3E9